MRSAVRSRLSPPKQKSHSVRNGFFVLAGHTWREKRCGSTECIFAAQKRRFFCMQCRKHKKMQSARSKRSLRSIPLIFPLSFLEKRMHFCSHATRPRFDPNGRKRGGFIEIYLTKQHEYFLNDINQIPASGGQFTPACGVLPMDFPAVLCYTERKDANAAEVGRFSACMVSILQSGVSG